MNKQGKLIDGKVVGGIEWVKTFNPDGTERQGYTWNPVGGCKHACRWTMPDGTVAKCYAESVAEGVAQSAYPHKFAHHYWNPERLKEPARVKTPGRIFLDSMSDLMGHWVPENQIEAVLDACDNAHWHTFQLLTKNAPRLKKFDFPKNVWVGVSAPPTEFMGKQLSLHQQEQFVLKQMDVFYELNRGRYLEGRDRVITWMSVEPLSFDIAPILEQSRHTLDWIVIGAASNGRATFQPEKIWVENLLVHADYHSIPVFFKGNLEWEPRREEYP